MYSHIKWGIWNKPISRNAKTTTKTNSAYGQSLPILPNSQMKVIRQFLKTAFQEVSMKHCTMSKNFSLPRCVLLHSVSYKENMCLQQLMILDIRMLLRTLLTLNKKSARYFSSKIGLFRNNRIVTQNRQPQQATCKSTKTKQRKFLYRGEKLGWL